jgi:signal transduction histidine kinase
MTEKRPLILYVDDERANRIVFEQSFGKLLAVRAVSSGAEALAVLEREPVAVLVTDQRMPEMSGHELLVEVKNRYPDIVRIVITAYTDFEPIQAALNEGLVARYLVKPWDRAELEQVLRWALALYELSRTDSTLGRRLLQNERLAAIGTLSHSILHDVNQPVTHLLVNSKRIVELGQAAPLLARFVADPKSRLEPADRQLLEWLSAELPELGADLIHGCGLLLEIVESLRRFLDPGSAAPDARTSTDPLPAVRFAKRVSDHIALKARGRIVIDEPPAIARVRMCETALSQVLINLTVNAAQALLVDSKAGGRVTLSLREEGDRVRFTVEDNGPGMPQEVLARVGTAFFTTRPDGTGFGLVQCRRLVGTAGGNLELESEPQKGTRASFAIAKADPR